MIAGWTYEQWSLALGLSDKKDKTFNECMDIWRQWRLDDRPEPLEKCRIPTLSSKDERKRDYDGAFTVITHNWYSSPTQ